VISIVCHLLSLRLSLNMRVGKRWLQTILVR